MTKTERTPSHLPPSDRESCGNIPREVDNEFKRPSNDNIKQPTQNLPVAGNNGRSGIGLQREVTNRVRASKRQENLRLTSYP